MRKTTHKPFLTTSVFIIFVEQNPVPGVLPGTDPACGPVWNLFPGVSLAGTTSKTRNLMLPGLLKVCSSVLPWNKQHRRPAFAIHRSSCGLFHMFSFGTSLTKGQLFGLHRNPRFPGLGVFQDYWPPRGHFLDFLVCPPPGKTGRIRGGGQGFTPEGG